MKKAYFLIVALPFLFATFGGPSNAAIFSSTSYPAYMSGEKAVIYYDSATQSETLIISTTFNGPAKEFTILVPTPSEPSIKVVRDELFSALADLTQPIYYDELGINPLYQLSGFSGANRVTPSFTKEISTKNIDNYTVSVLKSTDLKDFKKWLSANGYTAPKDADFVIKNYINDGYFFVAAKVNTEALGPFVEGQLREGHINPLQITFKSEYIIFPLRLTGIMGSQYPLNQNCPECYWIAPQKAPAENVIPEPMPSKPGRDQVYQYRPSGMNLTLYVIADGKKYVSGFNTEYAGSVKKEKLEGLSTLKTGDPWMVFPGKKYLTKLTRYMSFYEMGDDLVISNAENNTPVGTGEIYLKEPFRLVLVIFLPLILEILLIVYFVKKRRLNNVS